MLKRVDPSGVGQDPNRRAIVGLVADRAEGIAAAREYLERGWGEPRPGSRLLAENTSERREREALERAARDRVRGRLLAPARLRRPG
jgi:hypothetical protein